MVGSANRANSGCLGITFIPRAGSGIGARSSPKTRRDGLSQPGVDSAALVARKEDGRGGCNDDWCRVAGAPEPCGRGVVASRRNQDRGKVLELRKIKLQWSGAASVHDHAGAAGRKHSRHRIGLGFYGLDLVLSGTFRGAFGTEVVSASSHRSRPQRSGHVS